MTMPPYERHTPQPLAETVAAARAAGDPCLKILGDLSLRLQEFGQPDGMYRVGTIDGVQFAGQGASFDVELPALLPGVGEGHVALDDGDHSYEIARSLLYQMLAAAPPGAVRFDIYDPNFSGAFSEFAALPENSVNIVAPGGLRSLMDDYARHVTDARNSKKQIGTAANPHRVMLLAGTTKDLDGATYQQLQQLMASGADWGSVLAIGVPGLEKIPGVHAGWPQGYRITLDPPLPSEAIQQVVAQNAEDAKKVEPLSLDDVYPLGEVWTKSARNGVELLLGGMDGKPHIEMLNDDTPHGIITGASGSGKTITVRSIVVGASQMYSPDEVRFGLLDFKEGTGIQGMAPSPGDPTYLPNVRFVGSNINKDLEFGMMALRSYQNILEERGKLSKQVGATGYSELRDRLPDMSLPREVLIIDEFQVLLSSPKYGTEAVALLEDLVRRGRSFGLHVLLASQAVGGIPALVTKGDLFNNFVLRVAGTGGSLLSGQHDNQVAIAKLPKHHLLVNTSGGAPGGETVIRTTGTFGQPLARRQEAIWKHRRPADLEPKSFDAEKIPVLKDTSVYQKLKPRKVGDPSLIVGEEYNVDGGSASVRLTRQPGRNVAVVGTRTQEVDSVMHTAARSLARQLPEDGSAKITLVCMEARHHGEAVENLASELAEDGHYVDIVRESQARDFFAKTREGLNPDSDESHYIFVYGADSDRLTKKPNYNHTITLAPDTKMSSQLSEGTPIREGERVSDFMDSKNPTHSPVTGKVVAVDTAANTVTVNVDRTSGRKELSELIANGPQNGVHIIGTFTEPKRLGTTISDGPMGRSDGFGAYVNIGYSDNEMTSYTPGASHAHKPDDGMLWRARFFDRAQGPTKLRTIMPYIDPAVPEPPEED